MTQHTFEFTQAQSFAHADRVWRRGQHLLGTLDLGSHITDFPAMRWHTVSDSVSLAEVQQWLARVGLGGLQHRVTLSTLPAGVSLPQHRDVGRRTVIITPISGFDAPIVIEGQEHHYRPGHSVMTNAKQSHEVPAGTQDRASVQVSFRHSFRGLLARVQQKALRG